MENEVVTKAKNELSTEMASMMQEMDYSAVEARHLKIPKLLLMQQMSKYVVEDDICKAGDIVNSLNGEVYGSIREKDYSPVRVIPIQMLEQWVVQEDLGNGKWDYVETVRVTPQNTDWEWNAVVDGKKLKRTKNLSFFVLLEKDLGNPLALPFVVTFRSTSYKKGLVLAHHFALCKTAKEAGVLRVPMDRVFEVGGGVEKNDKGTFYVLNIREVSHATTAAMNQAFGWYKQIKQSSKKFEEAVDTSEYHEEAPSRQDQF
jgi:hypothetical protein